MSGSADLIPDVEWLARPARALAAAEVSLHHDDSDAAYFGLRPAELSERSPAYPERRGRELLGEMGWSAAQIEAGVQALRALWARRDGRRNFNGDIARLDAFRFDGARLSLWTRRTSWWTLTISNFALRGTIFDGIETGALRALLLPEVRAGVTPNAKLANGLAVQITAVTADDKIVLVQRGDQGTEAGLWASGASGSIQPRDAHPFEAARRELAEELGVEATVDGLRLQALVVESPERDPVLLFRARLAATYAEVRRLAARAADGYEAARLAPLDLGEIGRARLMQGFCDGDPSVPPARETAAWQQKALAGLLLTFDDPP